MGYLELLREKKKEKEYLREKALKEAKRLSKLLKEKFDYDTLYLIGSVVKGKGFTQHSDIDFVIRGLKRELFFKTLSLLMTNSTFDIDLKPYEELDEDSRQRIEKEGMVLY